MVRTSTSPEPEPVDLGTPGRPAALSARTPPRLPARVAARVLTTQAALALVVGLAFLACYAGLQRDPRPLHLPLAVVGAAAQPTATTLGAIVSVTQVADDAAARRAVLRGDEVAALSYSDRRAAVLYVAGANGLAENGAVEQVVGAFAERSGATLHVVDLVPTVPFDPRGLASFYVALAATVSSFILAQAMFALRQLIGLRAQVLTLVAFATVVGTALAVVASLGLHVVSLSMLALAPVLSLLSLAVAFGSRALIAWFGPVGITLATLAMTAIGLSTSGGILGEHLLPRPLGTLGSLLPPGAGLRALVSLGYFSGHHAIASLLVLGLWAFVGLSALILRNRRNPGH